MKLLIINTGGTFNKIYNEVKGTLTVPKNNHAIKDMLKRFLKKNNDKIEVKGIIFKDSLDFTNKDRELILNTIKNSSIKKIIIIHGTDTIDLSANFLQIQNLKGKQIVFTGAMKPYSIDPVEATANFASAYGYINALHSDGIYISMNGHIEKPYNIHKDKKHGIFECRKK